MPDGVAPSTPRRPPTTSPTRTARSRRTCAPGPARPCWSAAARSAARSASTPSRRRDGARLRATSLYIDPDAGRRAIAEGYGARTLDHVPERLDERFPITVDAAGTPEALALALGSLDRDGVCTSAAIYFDPATIPPFPLLSMYVMATTFVTGRIHARADAPAVLDLLAEGTLRPGAGHHPKVVPSTTPPTRCWRTTSSWCFMP